jgi:hypothetical protein
MLVARNIHRLLTLAMFIDNVQYFFSVLLAFNISKARNFFHLIKVFWQSRYQRL